MSTKKSTVITNNEATPQTLNTAGTHGGRVRIACDSFELATTDLDASDIILLDKLPANAVIVGLYLMSDDLDSNGTPTLAANVGLYESDGATAADADCFASAITTLQSATTSWQDILAEAGTAAVANIGDPLWDVAGDSQGDFEEYYVALTLSAAAATAAAGTLAYKIEYVVD